MDESPSLCLGLDRLTLFADGALLPEEHELVNGHLDVCARCRGLLAELLRSTGEGELTEVPEPGRTFGRYAVVTPLGAGGMGVVYEAFDPALDRKVALKLLRSALGDADQERENRGRLLREAQALAKLSHPNVIIVHDAGTVGEQAFFAMELVDGAPLGDWLTQQPRRWREIRDLFVQAGRGLAAAHQAGIVHRDFKPDNVLVGSDGRPRVTDFGLSRPPRLNASNLIAGETEPPSTNASLTRSGTILGTPRYMSPEQFEGRPADARSDQFSFCVALYEALYGRRPFEGNTLETLREQVVAGKVLPPPSATEVPTRIRRALLRGLSVRPEDRFASMTALLELLAADPLPARLPWLAATVAVAACVVAAVGFTQLVARQTARCRGSESQLAGIWDEARREAVHRAFVATGKPYAEATWKKVAAAVDAYALAWVGMRQEACEATWTRGEQSETLFDLRMACLDRRQRELAAFSDLLAHLDASVLLESVQGAHRLTELRECADTATLAGAMTPPQGAAGRVRLAALQTRLAHAKALADVGAHHEANDELGPLAAEARVFAYRPFEADLLILQGGVLIELADWPEAEATLRRAVLAAEASHDCERAARAYLKLTHVSAFFLARAAQGTAEYEHAAANLECLGEAPELTAELDFERANLLQFGLSKPDEARAAAEQSLAEYLASVGRFHPRVAELESLLGQMYAENNQHAKAREHHEASLEIRRRLFGPEHPEVARSLNNYALSEQYAGDNDSAIEHFRQALAIFAPAYGPDHLRVATLRLNLASAQIQGHCQSDLSASSKLHEEIVTSRQLLERAIGAKHPRMGNAWMMEAEAHRRRGEYREAKAAIDEALEIFRESVGPTHEWTLLATAMAAESRLALGALKDAERSATELLRVLKGTPGDHAYSEASAQFTWTRAVWAQGRGHEQTRASARRARELLVTAGPQGRCTLDEVDEWLARH